RRELAHEFWQFSAPRAAAGLFQTIVFSLDLLLLGSLGRTPEVPLYSAAGRLAIMGTFALGVIAAPLGPQIAHLLARGDSERAERVFQTATSWIVLASWPFEMALIVWAPVALRFLGHRFGTAGPALVVLAIGMLVQIGTGNNRVVLLMGGRSGYNLAFSAVALVANVGLNVVLIPRYGMTGAAVAWTVTIVIDNGLTTVAVRALMGLQPFGRGVVEAAIASALCYGALGGVLRL